MQINCIAIDDEPLALEIIEEYAGKIPYLNLKASFDNAFNALQYLKTEKVDLLFLDIQMPDITGVQLAQILPANTHVVFITAYDFYAVKSYELNAVDYILKPFEFDRFWQACEKVSNLLAVDKSERETVNTKSTDAFFFVKSEYRMQKIFEKDILYIEGMKNYIKIFTKADKVLTLQSFKKTEQMLSPDRFIRVHKSFIVAIDQIDFIERNRICIGDIRIPIGETYKEAFYKILDKVKIG
jgi:DNA-binding LytR/AlgR family response regulator